MKKVTISIKGCQRSQSDDDESFELTTDGEYTREGGVTLFSYMESELTGYAGMQTTFSVENDAVVLNRADGMTGELIFSKARKHHFLYETDFGSLMMGVDTHNLSQRFDEDGGELEIEYDIDVDNVVISRNTFEISVRPA